MRNQAVLSSVFLKYLIGCDKKKRKQTNKQKQHTQTFQNVNKEKEVTDFSYAVLKNRNLFKRNIFMVTSH